MDLTSDQRDVLEKAARTTFEILLEEGDDRMLLSLIEQLAIATRHIKERSATADYPVEMPALQPSSRY